MITLEDEDETVLQKYREPLT